MRNRKKEFIIITIVLILQSIIFLTVGMNKSYIHMDEAYSLGLASYDKVEIQDNQDFYNNWHSKEYYEDYLIVNENEVGKYEQVYENQKNDVHPPLYYLFLRIFMGFNKNSFSMWPGIILNIIIFLFITVFMYLILQKIFNNQTNSKEKAIILSFISSITMSSLTNVIYIRMYALSSLNILITTYLHLKLLDTKKANIENLILIGISALIGSLTHYYYLFYLAMLYILFAIKYIKEKNYKTLINYTLTMSIAGIVSLLIFPYSIQHMFFGYRGQGFISNLLNIPQFLNNIKDYLIKINTFVFNKLLFTILIIMALIAVILLIKKRKILKEKNKYMMYIILPTLFYFLLVSIASPWIELRYVMPICSLIFVIVLYYSYNIISNLFDEKKSNIIICILLIVILVSPFVFNLQPEVAYADKKEIVEKLSTELNLPTLYLFNSQNNRFLDDILLFAKLEKSYIAKDIKCTEDNIKQILEKINTSKGLIIFINEGQENDELLNVIKKSTDLIKVTYLNRLNACDLYLVN